MAAYKTIAQNFADTSKALEATAQALAAALELPKIVAERDALLAENAELRRQLAERPRGLKIGGAVAVGRG